MAKSAQRQFLIKVDGIDNYFSTKTGGSITADPTKAYDGGNPVPDLISAPPNAENITIGRTYDPDRDDAYLRRLRREVGSFRATISVTPTDADYVATAPPVVYPQALLVGLTEPDVDASSGDAATFQLEFAIGGYR